ncbi:MAG: ABC transporter ATP-binding protein [Candidatus Paracaedibacteraceae bacterium]|nr:ABC transporter ATP-binding protein [Candidatus Paracaedibacteraceae bacterium]
MFKKLSVYFEQLVDPYPQALPFFKSSSLMKFIWLCSDGLKKYIIAMTVLTMIVGVLEALIFSYLGEIVNLLSSINPSQLWVDCGKSLIVLSCLLLLSPFPVAALTLFKFQTIQGNFPMRLRWNFHRLLLNQSMEFFQKEFSGGVATKVMQTALAVRGIVIAFLDIFVYVLIYFFSAAMVLYSFDFWLLLPFSIWLGLYLAVCAFFLPRLTRVANEQADARSLTTGRISDAYANISTVKLFSHTNREANYVREAMREFMVPVYEQQRLVSAFDLSTHAMSMLLVFSTAAIAIWLWMKGQVGVGVVAVSIAMSLRFNSMSQWAMWVVADLFEHIGTAQDGMEMLSRPIALVDNPYAKPLIVKSGTISFENVSFSYDDGKQVLKDFNLKILPGEKIGLVGRSGAGKSTIINLLLRFYDVNSGNISIDGQNIRYACQDSLRSQIGMVTQDTSLLHRSIRDNILYGRPDALEHEMVLAAKRAEADLFIRDLQDANGRVGYDTHVGERGVKLSGGQRQRISIARIMLKNAPILLLDEATSALDSEVELAIQSSLYTLMKGKTVLAIAHRLSTIAAMDRLIVLDEGKIVEEGSHKELLNKKGLYFQLWNHQSGGFLSDGYSQ